MKRYADLMSADARSRAAARANIRRWSAALALAAVAVIPTTMMRWRQTRDVRRSHEALEARFEPVRRMSEESRLFRNEAAELVNRDRVPLELSRRPSLAPLLTIVSEATAITGGEIFVEKLTVLEPVVGDSEAIASERKLVIEAAGSLAYDLAPFVTAMQKSPIKTVKVLANQVAPEDGVERKQYTLECLY